MPIAQALWLLIRDSRGSGWLKVGCSRPQSLSQSGQAEANVKPPVYEHECHTRLSLLRAAVEKRTCLEMPMGDLIELRF